MQKVAGSEEWRCELGDDDDIFERECEGVFVSALRNMVYLESFQWGPSHHDWYCDAEVKDVWAVLAQLPHLSSVNVTYWRQEAGFDML